MIEYTVKVYSDGSKSWYLNGKRHREDGPALEWADGTKYWFLNDKYHREDGPAVEYANGDKFWYLDDIPMTEQEHQQRTNPAKEYSVAEIEALLGHKVKIVK